MEQEIEEGSIIARPIVDPALKRTLHLASLRERPRTRALDEVSRIVVSVILAEIRKGRWEARPFAA